MTPIDAIISDVGGGLIVVVDDDEDNDKLFNPPFFLLGESSVLYGVISLCFSTITCDSSSSSIIE